LKVDFVDMVGVTGNGPPLESGGRKSVVSIIDSPWGMAADALMRPAWHMFCHCDSLPQMPD